MQNDATLIQLGYVPNESLIQQFENIKNNTTEFEKIEKHIMDLHEHLQVNKAYVAMSNTKNYFKIKIEAEAPEQIEEAHKKVKHFSEKYKVDLEKVKDKETYYILGFHH